MLLMVERPSPDFNYSVASLKSDFSICSKGSPFFALAAGYNAGDLCQEKLAKCEMHTASFDNDVFSCPALRPKWDEMPSMYCSNGML